jgi:hypothetical protein
MFVSFPLVYFDLLRSDLTMYSVYQLKCDLGFLNIGRHTINFLFIKMDSGDSEDCEDSLFAVLQSEL